jgi:hypothetical protein
VFNRDDRPLGGYYRGYHYAESRNGHASSRWSRMLRRARGNGAGD